MFQPVFFFAYECIYLLHKFFSVSSSLRSCKIEKRVCAPSRSDGYTLPLPSQYSSIPIIYIRKLHFILFVSASAYPTTWGNGQEGCLSLRKQQDAEKNFTQVREDILIRYLGYTTIIVPSRCIMSYFCPPPPSPLPVHFPLIISNGMELVYIIQGNARALSASSPREVHRWGGPAAGNICGCSSGGRRRAERARD